MKHRIIRSQRGCRRVNKLIHFVVFSSRLPNSFCQLWLPKRLRRFAASLSPPNCAELRNCDGTTSTMARGQGVSLANFSDSEVISARLDPARNSPRFAFIARDTSQICRPRSRGFYYVPRRAGAREDGRINSFAMTKHVASNSRSQLQQQRRWRRFSRCESRAGKNAFSRQLSRLIVRCEAGFNFTTQRDTTCGEVRVDAKSSRRETRTAVFR